MLNRLYNTMRTAFGRQPLAIDEGIPSSWLALSLATLVPQLLRGIVRCRKPVFIDSHVRLRNARRISWGRGCKIGRGSTIDGLARVGVTLGAGSRIGEYSTLTCTSHVSRLGTGFTLGARSGFGDYCHFGASGGIVIGADVLGGSYVSFHSQNHLFEDGAKLIRDQGVTESGIVVGDDCWIGAKVTFLDGSRIGSHCVVAAGAVVKGEFPDNVVLAGVPARVVRQIGPNE